MTEKQTDNSTPNVSVATTFPVHPVVGQLTASEIPGEILVICNGRDPRPAQLLSGINRSELIKRAESGQRVLVIFINGNPDEPVIAGMMENALEEMVYINNGSVDALVDGERVVIRADKEIHLACGEGSITITGDGRIVVKGRDILSRASGSNKIKGSNVELN